MQLNYMIISPQELTEIEEIIFSLYNKVSSKSVVKWFRYCGLVLPLPALKNDWYL